MTTTIEVQPSIRNSKVNTFVVSIKGKQHVVLVYNKVILTGTELSKNFAVVLGAKVKTNKEAEACFLKFKELYEEELDEDFHGFFQVGNKVVINMPVGRFVHKLVKS